MSRGFACALFGLAITIFAWFSHWSWPAWPAFAVLTLFSKTDPKFGPAIVVLSVAANVAGWALAAYAVQWLIARWRAGPAD